MRKDELCEFIGENGHFSTIFDFSAHCLSDGAHGWYDAPEITFEAWREAIVNSQLEVQEVGLEANIIENHDEPRGVSRFLPAYAQNPAGAKMLGTVNILLRGIPFIYQGQELGMMNAVWNSIDEFDDISTKDQYKVAKAAGLTDDQAMKVCAAMSRDNARTPMQWSDEENAGFTTGTPWLKVNENYTKINARQQEMDPDSVLQYYRRLIALRKDPAYREVFAYGKFAPAFAEVDKIMAYYRKTEEKTVLIAANFGETVAELKLDATVEDVLLTNGLAGLDGDVLRLESCGVAVMEMKQ